MGLLESRLGWLRIVSRAAGADYSVVKNSLSRKWEKMGLVGTFSKGSSPISRCTATERLWDRRRAGCLAEVADLLALVSSDSADSGRPRAPRNGRSTRLEASHDRSRCPTFQHRRIATLPHRVAGQPGAGCAHTHTCTDTLPAQCEAVKSHGARFAVSHWLDGGRKFDGLRGHFTLRWWEVDRANPAVRSNPDMVRVPPLDRLEGWSAPRSRSGWVDGPHFPARWTRPRIACLVRSCSRRWRHWTQASTCARIALRAGSPPAIASNSASSGQVRIKLIGWFLASHGVCVGSFVRCGRRAGCD